MRRFNLMLLLLLAVILTGSVTWLALSNINVDAKEETQIHLILKAKPDRLSFWSQMTEGAKIAGTEFDANIVVTAPEREVNIHEQIEMVQEAIDEKTDAIIIAATDYYALSDICNEAMKAGIVVVTIDSDIDLDSPHSYIATNNINASKRLSYELSGIIGGKGEILIVGHVLGASTTVDRIEGFTQGIKPSEQIELYDKIFYADDNEDKAYDMTKEFLENNRIDAIFATNEVTLTGVGRAVKDLGLEETVYVVGFDVNNNIMQMLENGAVDITMIQRPFNMGYLAVEEVIDLFNKSEVQTIDTGSVMITKDIMFSPENQRLLVPGAKNHSTE